MPRWAQEFHNRHNVARRASESPGGGVTLKLFQARSSFVLRAPHWGLALRLMRSRNMSLPGSHEPVSLPIRHSGSSCARESKPCSSERLLCSCKDCLGRFTVSDFCMAFGTSFYSKGEKEAVQCLPARNTTSWHWKRRLSHSNNMPGSE